MKPEYYLWTAGIAFALAAFSCAIMAIGYQPLTIGRGATTLLLIVVGVSAFVLHRKRRG